MKKANDVSLSLPEGLVIRTIMNNSEDTIYFKNLESKFILNSKAHAIQFNEDNVLNLVGKRDFDYFPNEFSRAAYEAEQAIITTGQAQIGIIEKWEKPNGEVIWFSASKYPLYDENNNIIGTWGTSRNITPLKKAEEELILLNQKLTEANQRLEILSTRDGLSGLYNHRHFFDTLAITKAHKNRLRDSGFSSEYSIILIDIDNFKKINDTYGHLVGDSVIYNIGELLVKSIRLTDTCFRIGGDEFAILQVNTSLDNARLVAEKIRSQVMLTPLMIENHMINLTVSIGVASSSEVEEITDLIALCDTRMYESKRNGRNQVT
ncbi:MAG: PAS/PAC sensor-containing diguanylate cyclase [Erysipelotrichaceae bacterium]|nr:MAG: PAS/PAC sensor-containing diguanylate [Erysipelotrichaceae bacterium]TXT18614.1 MAG: PAS/PAC sensor-containing diguanylate cyclase [Erysipelotrichaceae bacterium]